MLIPENADAMHKICNDGVTPSARLARAQLLELKATALIRPVLYIGMYI
jgi:hypothetical protein